MLVLVIERQGSIYTIKCQYTNNYAYLIHVSTDKPAHTISFMFNYAYLLINSRILIEIDWS